MVDVIIVEICRNGLRRKNVPTCQWWYMYRRRGALTGPFFFFFIFSSFMLCHFPWSTLTSISSNLPAWIVSLHLIMNKESLFSHLYYTNYSFIKNSLLFTCSERLNSLLDLKKKSRIETKENVVHIVTFRLILLVTH